MTTFVAIEHVQLGMPPGGEAAARAFYIEVIWLQEIAPPPPLSGIWFRAGGVEVHLNSEAGFRAGSRAHPGIQVRGLAELAGRCEAAGLAIRRDERYPARSRFYVADPFDNQLEFLEVHATAW